MPVIAAMELRRGIAEERDRGAGHGGSDARNDELWHVHVEPALHDERGSTSLHGLRGEIVPVDRRARDAEEE